MQAVADPAALAKAFGKSLPRLHLFKPYVGHTIGASGLLESVILAEFLKGQQLPPNLLNLSVPIGFLLPAQVLDHRGLVYKLSHGMGGHNALLVLSTP